jgi:hypothetical protein
MANGCKDCSDGEARYGLSRRALLRNTVGGFLGFAMSRQADLFGAPRPELLLPQEGTRAAGKSLIILWMVGGPSQFETWSPLEGRDNGGPTKALQTSVKDIQYAENMKVCATQAQHISLVRSMVSREGSHERGRYLLHTGYVPTGTVVHPSLGAVTAMEIGKKESELPNFISVGGTTDGAGFLPPEHNPFVVQSGGGGGGGGRRPGGGSGTASIPNITYGQGVDRARFRERLKLLQEQESDFEKERGSDEVTRHKTAYAKADKLMHTPLLEAFDLGKEKPDLVSAYGDSNFGRGCLLARRLVERGVSCVEVSLGGWDTHQENFTKVTDNCRQLDPGMGTLIKDLNDRGLLKNTMVLWMGEFGRTPKVNGNNGRDHYPRAWSLAMAGGGIQGGRVVGATDRDGVEVKDRPVTVPDLFATVYSAMGVDFTKKNHSPLGRPIALSDNGVPVKELLT